MIVFPHPLIEFAGKERVRRSELNKGRDLRMTSPPWKLLRDDHEEKSETKNIGLGSGTIRDLGRILQVQFLFRSFKEC
jgi:hypothetical protein